MPDEPIYFIDRISGQRCTETIFGERSLRLLYDNNGASQWVAKPLRNLVSRSPLFSRFMGWYQNLPYTKRNIWPFVETHGIDATEFQKDVAQFSSFGDFFYRKLKPQARPIASGADVAVIPTDGRYYFYEDIADVSVFNIKGQTFDIAKFLQNDSLAKRYEHASVVLGRLCPSDYHRFHFATDGIPSAPQLVNGYLYSVNPLAIKRNISTFWENKRVVSSMQTQRFGEVICVEIGATSVGSINQTYVAGQPHLKGDEKGFFAFGGSALALLFLPGTIRFDADLLAATEQNMEIRCLLGQSMGRSLISRR